MDQTGGQGVDNERLLKLHSPWCVRYVVKKELRDCVFRIQRIHRNLSATIVLKLAPQGDPEMRQSKAGHTG